MRRSLTTLLVGLILAILVATGLAVVVGLPLAGTDTGMTPGAEFFAMLPRIAAFSVVPALATIWLAEMRRIRGIAYWAVVGIAIAIAIAGGVLMAAGGAFANDGPGTATAFLKFASIGMAAGCLYWWLAGRRSGGLAVALDAAATIVPGAPADRRCRVCTAVTLLLGLVPLTLIGWSAIYGGTALAAQEAISVHLVAQIGWLLLIAFLLGALVGYVVWRACGVPRLKSESAAQRCAIEDRVSVLERENALLEKAASIAEAAVRKLEAERAERPGRSSAVIPAASVAPPAERRVEPLSQASAAFLAAPRDGKPDNLKLIRGIGPRLEKILNAMGVFHFDQIASWTESDLALVDSRLGDFAGRAVRDKWVEQSRKFAERARSSETAGNVTP